LKNKQGRPLELWKRTLGRWIERELSRQAVKTPFPLSKTGDDRLGVSHRELCEKSIPSFDASFGEKSSSSTANSVGGVPFNEDNPKDGFDSPRQTPERVVNRIANRPVLSVGAPLSWEWIAGFYDGEGSILITIRKNSIAFEVTLSQKYRPLLECVQEFLNSNGIASSLYDRGTAYNLSVHSTDGIKRMLEAMLPYLRLKGIQARAVLDYQNDRISGDDVVRIFNGEVLAGRRKGMLRQLPAQLFGRVESIRRFRLFAIKRARETEFAPLEFLDYVGEE
jgi:hypothetical protein